MSPYICSQVLHQCKPDKSLLYFAFIIERRFTLITKVIVIQEARLIWTGFFSSTDRFRFFCTRRRVTFVAVASKYCYLERISWPRPQNSWVPGKATSRTYILVATILTWRQFYSTSQYNLLCYSGASRYTLDASKAAHLLYASQI